MAINHYQDEAGKAYFTRQNSSAAFVAQVNAFLFEPHITAQDEVLDFGCGGGHLLNVLRAARKVGVDINPAAREHALSLGFEAFATVNELADHQFTRIITSHALEHVPSPYDTLVLLNRKLRLGGKLIWLSPLDDWRAKHQRQWSPNDFDMHVYTWTPLLMGNLLQSAGYHPLSISVVTHAIPPAIVARRLWRISPKSLHFAARLWAMLQKRRQVLAVAELAI